MTSELDDITQGINAYCRRNFKAFAARAFNILEPDVHYEDNWHIDCICDHLMAVHRGEIDKLIINIPPRSLKSFLVSKAWPAWQLGVGPHIKFIGTSYSHTVAEANAIGCRRIIDSKWYKSCFPDTIIDPNMDRKTHFETTRAGQYYVDSALSSLTGMGCDYMLVDDPLKPMEALSETVRNSTNTNIRTTLFSRFNDRRTGKFIMIMQRTHEDDPSGNLLKDGGYVHLKLPAETKSKIMITLGEKNWEMAEGQLLFPARLNREALDGLIRDMTQYNYVGQYLQDPVPIGGGEFRPSEWIQFYGEGEIKPKEMNVYILCDPSAGEAMNKKKKKSSDWTAFVVVGLAPDQNYYLLDIVRDRLNPTERIDMLFILHRKWLALVGKPIKVGYEKYALMSDTHYIKLKQKNDGYRFPVVELGGTMAKDNRIRRIIPDAQNGRWYYPHNLLYTDTDGRTFDLVKELVESEMPSFPKARFDDMLDAKSRIYDADMGALFPALKVTGKQSIIGMGTPQKPDNWEDF